MAGFNTALIGVDAHGHGIVRGPDGKKPLPAWVSPTGERIAVRWRNYAPRNCDAAFERVARQIVKARSQYHLSWYYGAASATRILEADGWHRGGMQSTPADADPFNAEA